MTLEQHIDRAAQQCSNSAEVCLAVGDPFWVDGFKEILREFAKNVLEDEDVPKPTYEQ